METVKTIGEGRCRVTTGVLFVCMGNICRSPLAEGAMRRQLEVRGLDDIFVDSAATHDYHIGEPPDPRAQRVARQAGIDISGLRARQVQAEDFARFDFILAMDADNLADLERMVRGPVQSEIGLVADFAPPPWRGRAVPDPYYGGTEGFERVLEMVEASCSGLIAYLAGARGRH